MLPDLSIIKIYRKKAGVSQKELSRLLKISQSYLNKIENLASEPPYNLGKRIIETLKSLKNKNESVEVKSLMTKIKRVNLNKTVKEAVDLMHELGVSQLPVTDGVVIVGSFTKRTIPLLIKRGYKNVEELVVKDVMEAPFPMIPEDSPIQLVSNLLEYNEAVLLLKNGIFSGIISKKDLLKVLE
ncbi:MAG: CBS domain-containing protein [Nanoarchaeota archaeon]|nr:CBS domain-containing protein [Nanoarchaeota archaeon]